MQLRDTLSKYRQRLEQIDGWEKRKESARQKRIEAGACYERYIGFLSEEKGFSTIYYGILKGFDDHGIDLICARDKRIYIAQCKYWNPRYRKVNYKTILYLIGSTFWFYSTYISKDIKDFADAMSQKKIIPLLVVSHKVTDPAILALSKRLGVILIEKPMRRQMNKTPIKYAASILSNETSYITPSDSKTDYVIANMDRNIQFYQNFVQTYFKEIHYYLIKRVRSTQPIEVFYQISYRNIKDSDEVKPDETIFDIEHSSEIESPESIVNDEEDFDEMSFDDAEAYLAAHGEYDSNWENTP
ncbi:hypothetical protein [Selenomonas sp. TAMA-11512]|uniref:hypothetical protein n=1 Tax=Selenomonas sp. TAMA-11512 TaxID=3095337 RepID=UPI0030CBAFE7